MDAKVGLKTADETLFAYLCELKKPYIVVLTKADKLAPLELKIAMKDLGKRVSTEWAASPLIFSTSAKTSYGLAELRAYLAYLTLQQQEPAK